jgi:N-acetylmuramic acid 6-phosphate etherase
MSKHLHDQLKQLRTESRNPRSRAIDTKPVREILEIINGDDARIATAVREEIPRIEKAVELIVESFLADGRLLYVGAGTSGRLGILDAAECPPTYGTPPRLVTGIIAGGRSAMFRSQEGAEDSEDAGAQALAKHRAAPPDIVCGIAASARTPFVVGAIRHAAAAGMKTIYITTNSPRMLRTLGIRADVAICPNVGPEVITGSTRMKSGTAQKLVLNMLTTTAMIRMGKVYGNLMVDLRATNEKLRERAKRIVAETTGCDYEEAAAALRESSGSVKIAIVMMRAGITAAQAARRLRTARGFVRAAIDGLPKP